MINVGGPRATAARPDRRRRPFPEGAGSTSWPDKPAASRRVGTFPRSALARLAILPNRRLQTGSAAPPWAGPSAEAVIAPPFCSPSITPTTRCSAKWQFGSLIHFQPAGTWWALVPEEEWPTDGETREYIDAVWDSEYGDMRQEYVLIGVDLPHDELEAALTGALLTEAEFNEGEPAWRQMEDPLPRWDDETHGSHAPHQDVVHSQ